VVGRSQARSLLPGWPLAREPREDRLKFLRADVHEFHDSAVEQRNWNVAIAELGLRFVELGQNHAFDARKPIAHVWQIVFGWAFGSRHSL
jgi:hypothetical protein